jgi:uncharacterized protein YciI
VPERLHLLVYEYVEDLADRRGPFREDHLALIRRWHGNGRIRIAGALGDPPHTALIALAVDDPASEAEAFMAEDPYVAAGLVREWRVEPWTVVT